MHDDSRHAQTRMHKRRRDESTDEQINQTCKRQHKERYASGYPPHFWDTLSTVHLTRRALREFELRTRHQDVRCDDRRTTVPSRLLRSDIRRLKQLASKGGFVLDHLRGYSENIRTVETMDLSSRSSQKRPAGSSTPGSRPTKNTSPYSRNFEQKMIECGVYPYGYEGADGSVPKPGNMVEIQKTLRRRRSSLSLSRLPSSTFTDFERANRATSESKLLRQVIPMIAGDKDATPNFEQNIPFQNLTKFDPGLASPMPDLYYGARSSQINERVKRDLGPYITPSTRTNLPAAPNFFFEGKSPSGDPDVAQRQAMYDGAVGARGLYRLQKYGQGNSTPDGNAYTLSATYIDGHMRMYAHHPRPSDVRLGRTDYHTTHIAAYSMVGDVEDFRRGATAYRNARDWAKEQRDRIINETNARAQRMSTATPSLNRGGRANIGSSFASGRVDSSSDQTSREAAPAEETSSDELTSAKYSMIRR